MTDIRIAFLEPDSPPRFHHTDLDGDRLLITTALLPDGQPGIYFKTDYNGSGVPLSGLPALISQLQVIADAAKASAADDTLQAVTDGA